MKKTFKMIGMACLVGAFAFAGSSCKKNDTDTTSSFKVSLPAVEETTIGEERAYIDWEDGRYMKWSKDDRVMFYNLNSDYTKSIRNPYTLYEGAGTTTAFFHGNVMGDEQDLGYFAFYPAEKVEIPENDLFENGIGPRNSQTFSVPAEQTYNEGTMDAKSLVMACSEWAPTDAANFSHIFGFIKVRIKAQPELGYNKVEWVSVTDNTFHLSGDITIDLPGVDEEELERLINIAYNPAKDWENDYMIPLTNYLHSINYHGNGTGKTITLNCPEPVQLTADYKDFFITLRPGALAEGFKVTVKFEGIDQPKVFDKFDPNSPNWAYENYYAAPGIHKYPRMFTILPGYSMGTRVN